MNFYEVFVKLLSRGRKVGCTCIQISAISQFSAAIEAKTIVDERYGRNIYSNTIRVSTITEDEFLYQLAA